MRRRHFLCDNLLNTAAVIASAAGGPLNTSRAASGDSAPIPSEPSPPFRTIYSNDTTHILSCKMPWRSQKDELTDEHLRQSITEAAGVDAHFLQPGLGWIPWWPSKIYSPQDHYVEFLSREHGETRMNKVARYLLAGGDMLATLVETCRETNVAPFLSFRLNDGHHVRQLKEARRIGRPSDGMSRHYWENYERYRIGTDEVDWDQGVFDWSIPEVRDHKFALIEEACENYDLAGVELDFLRHWVRFGDRTPIRQRLEITTNFVQRVREMLDRTSRLRGMGRRWLCTRVPANPEVRPEQGIDLRELAKAGVDMINLSYSYFTWQDDGARRAIVELDDDRVAVYVEMTHTTMTGRATAGSGTQPFLRTTDQQFYSTANLAYQQGATGVSLFNFPYYRFHVTDAIGPFHEPPFHVLPNLKNREFLSRQPEWYFLTAGRKDRVLGQRRLPVTLQSEQTETFAFAVASARQRVRDGIVRLRSDENVSNLKVDVRFNDQRLERIPDVEKPLDHPFDGTWLGTPEERACYRLPAPLVGPGLNQLSATLRGGKPLRIIAIDVTVP